MLKEKRFIYHEKPYKGRDKNFSPVRMSSSKEFKEVEEMEREQSRKGKKKVYQKVK